MEQKNYVITDKVTAFVLRVLIYTGRSTYGSVEDQEERFKTVQDVNHLVQPFVGTYRTIYVDRFYTSSELLKSLEEKTSYDRDNAGALNSTGNPYSKDIPFLPPNVKRRCNQMQS
jgi:Transposase IS4